MSPSAPFIRRPIATTLLTLAIALTGALSYTLLPVSPLPQVEFPTISVSAGLPGASPETMASSVATPLERQFGRIAGVTEMTSSSGLGSTSITLQFDLSRNIDAAARDVQAAINAARGQLPANLPQNPSYRKVNPADAPIILLSLTSDVVDRARMYDLASTILQQKLAQVPGVGQVVVGGGTLPAVRVEVNPMALNQDGLSLEDVREALADANANRPKGSLGDNRRTWSIAATDQLHGAAEYQPLLIRYARGAALKLSDVARVTDSVEDLHALGLTNGKPAILLIISRQPGANIIGTVDRVRALLPQLQASLPPTIALSVAIDATRTIRASVRDVEITLVISILLVILVVFAFLRSARATFIPSVAVPISLVGTFGVMYLLGYSLDNLSLMALTVATGFVVDDAIVVVENVTRHLEQGMRPFAAALQGAREIGFTVLSISLSLVAVFLPILLMGGIVGRLFREFAVTLSVAIGVSLLVSLTTTPMMCARLLKGQAELSHGRLYDASERGFVAILRFYERTLGWVLRHQPATLAVTFATMAASVYLYAKIPKDFFPQQDTGRLSGAIQADQDTSFQAMQKRLGSFVTAVMQDPAVDSASGFIGGASSSGRMFVGLKAREDRVGADQVIARLREKLAHVPGAALYLQPVQDVRMGGRLGGAQYQYTLQADDAQELRTWAPQVLRALRRLEELTDVNSDQQDKGLEAALVVDRATASRLGIAPAAIDATLYDAFGQRQVSTSYTELNQYHVVMEVAPEFSQDPGALEHVYVKADDGTLVPLSAIARYETSTAPLTVNHSGQFPSVTISFNLLPGVALGRAIDAIQAAQTRLGLPSTIRGSFAGTAQAFQASLANEPLLIAAALLTVYIVLGVLYESLVHPLTILSTLPSAGVGALLALLLTGNPLSIMSLIGIILLIGIVKKNGILMVDFAIESERKEGKKPEQAIYQACLLRFRPITMTTMAALLGGLPLAIGVGTGSELRRPLGIAIVGGLLLSQLLTLYTTPVVYLHLDRFRLRWAERRGLRTRELLRAGALLAALLTFAGCALGPAYVRPAAEVPVAFKEAAPPGQRPEHWKPAAPRDQEDRGSWWHVFADRDLDALEAQVDASNQDLAHAEAIFRAARATARGARADLFPVVTAGASFTRARVPPRPGVETPVGVTSLYEVPFDISWEADVFGRIRRGIEANVASAQESAADLEALRLSLHAELAADWFDLHGLDAQRELLETALRAYATALRLTQNRHDQGVVSGVDVAQAETQLETTRVELKDLDIERAQLEHAIAVLIGKPPAELSLPRASLPASPPRVEGALPTELLERRPDVASAERGVAAANAQRGVATAGFFPRFLLDASAGFESGVLSRLFSLPSRFWSLGPSIVETLFSGGKRRAALEQARASYDASVATYRQSVLAALQEVEDRLVETRVLAEEAEQEALAVAASERELTLARNRYQNGITSYLEVVTAQSAALANERAAVLLSTRRMTASVGLVKALGGGWDASTLPAPGAVVSRLVTQQ